MPINRALLSSVLTNIALLAFLLGLAGFVNHLILDESRLPVLTAFGSFPGLLVGMGFICLSVNRIVWARCFGLLCISYSLILWFAELHTLSEQFHQPPDIMIFNLLLVGVYFFTYRLHSLSWIIATLTAAFGLGLGLSALAEIWFTQNKLTSANNIFELSVFAMMILLVAVAVVIAHLLSRHRSSPRSRTAWVPALIVQAVTISLWVYLTAAQVTDLEQRGHLSIQQTGEAVDEMLSANRALLARYAERIANTETERRENAIRTESFRVMNDANHVDAVTFINQSQIRWQSVSKSENTYTYLTEAPYQRWMERLSGEYALTLDPKTALPTAMMASRISSISDTAYLIFHLDVSAAMASIDDSYFDVFTKVIQLGPSRFVSDDPDEISGEQSAWLIENSSVLVEHQYQLNVGYPVTIYAVLTRPGVIADSVRMHQLVLLAGFIFSIVLTFALMSNRRLQILATHDTVTHLYRRPQLEKILQQTILGNNANGWILFIDLDGFKPINDSLGINIGNQVLVLIAERLRRNVPAQSHIARFSSDEFIVFVPRSDSFNVEALCLSLLSSVRQKISIDGFTLYLTASIGVYAIQPTTRSASEAIQSADVAMSSAKEFGGNTYRVYTDDMAKQFERSLTLRNQLQDALDANEIEVFYQPIVEARSGRVASVEALARWRQADGSFIPPSLFIPIAEQTGQIKQLSELVFQQAMTDLADLSGQHDFSLSLNCSMHQFHASDMISQLKSLSELTRFPLNQLCIEITESVFIKDLHVINEQLMRLREHGIKVAIDDFGTGYSSLSYLNVLPVDNLKIDRSFTLHVDGSNDRYPLVSSIIALAHSVGKQVVVEGIETRTQADFFRQQNCQYLQGYGYAKPVSLEQLEKLLANHPDGLPPPMS